MSDIATVWDLANRRGDYVVVPPGLQGNSDLYTACLISIFTDRLAEPSDKIPDGSTDRRGWSEDDPDNPIGSRLWLIYRATNTDNILNQARDYVAEAVQWLIDDGVVASWDITVEFTNPKTLGIKLVGSRVDGTKTPALQYAYVWSQL